MSLKKLPFGIKISTSDSGITIITKEFSGNNLGYIKFVVGTGSVHDDLYGLNGVAHIVEHVIFRGVREEAISVGPMPLSNHQEISFEVEGRGAEINGENSYLSVTYTGMFHKSDFHTLSELLFKVVMMPRLSDEDIQKERNIVCAELAMNLENPLCGDDIDKAYYVEKMRELLLRRNPMRNRIGGRIPEVKKIKPDMIRDAFESFYVPNNMAFIVLGPFTHGEVARRIREFEKRYGAMMPTRKRSLPQLDERTFKEKKIKEVARHFWGNDFFRHATANMAYQAPDRSNRDTPAITILNGMFGAMEFGKLLTEFRGIRANAYYADSRYFQTPLHGEFRLHVNLFPKKGERIRSLINCFQDFVIEELNKIRRGDVDIQLFEKTKSALYRYDRKISLEGPEDVGALLVRSFEEKTFRKDKSMQAIIRSHLEEGLRIKSCSLDRFIQAVQNHIDPEHYALLVSGPLGC